MLFRRPGAAAAADGRPGGVAASCGREGRHASAGRSPAGEKPHAVFPGRAGRKAFCFFLPASGVTTGRSVLPKRGEKARGFSCPPGSVGNVRRYEDAVFQKHRGRERRAPFQQKRESAKASSREPAFFLMLGGRRPASPPPACCRSFAAQGLRCASGLFPGGRRGEALRRVLHRGRACRLGRRRARKNAEGTEGVTPCSALCRGSLPGLRKSVFLPCAEYRRPCRERRRSEGENTAYRRIPRPLFVPEEEKFRPLQKN